MSFYDEHLYRLSARVDNLKTNYDLTRKDYMEMSQPQDERDDLDRSSQMQFVNFAESLMKQSKIQLDKAELALSRFKSKQVDFDGCCVVCGYDIPQKRLEIAPESFLCIECVAIQERRSQN
jgi:RNA polymerase-binding transcription factor DksA